MQQEITKPNITVVGTGYIGLVGAAIFADWGHKVWGVDVDPNKIAKLKNAEIPIYEPGLEDIVKSNISNGNLNFTTSLAEGLKNSEIVFICVGTPQSSSGEADLKYVYGVAKEIGELLDDYKIIIVKSTVPIGTNEKVKEIIRENLKKDISFDVVSNPEFLREGTSVEDMRNTDRTVIGSDSKIALQKVRQIYTHLNSPIIETDFRTAELIKYAANSFVAMKITYINEIGQICDKSGANVEMLAKAIGLDKRIGEKYLKVGPGFGGSCFPKDVHALSKISQNYSYDFKILNAVILANDLQREFFVQKITDKYGENLNGKTISVLGLAFKADTDDTRESVPIKIIKTLRGLGATIRAYDPAAIENTKKELGNSMITYCNSASDCIKGSDILCILTEWKEFKNIDMTVLQSLKDKTIFDGRNLLNPDEIKNAGLTYIGLGINNGTN